MLSDDICKNEMNFSFVKHIYTYIHTFGVDMTPLNCHHCHMRQYGRTYRMNRSRERERKREKR